MMIMVSCVLFILSVILMVQVFLSDKISLKSESISPLESGFESLMSSMSVSAPFFFLAILFVLFDLEIVLFFPGVVPLSPGVIPFFIWSFINFLVLLTLVIEWAFCGLKWQI